MKRKERRFKLYGLRARLGLALAVSAVICIAVFLVLNTGLEHLFFNYYEHSDFELVQLQRQQESLQSFIDANGVSTQNLSLLKKWEKKEPIILLELYSGNKCIYSSVYDVPDNSRVFDDSAERQNAISLRLADGEISALIYSDFTYRFIVLKTAVSIVAALVLFILLFLHNSRKLIQYICCLNEEVQILEGGNLEYCVSEEGNDEITDLARSMNRMRVTLQQQMEWEQHLQNANRKLITEMSHDLRTPLTGIMLYLEILRTHRYESEEQLQDYLEKIDAKAHHMKLLTDHLFEYSMQGNPDNITEPAAMEPAFKNAVIAFMDDMKTRGFGVEAELKWENCFVQINQEFIHRIFENIASNTEKYADKEAGIRIETVSNVKYCGLSFMNTFAGRCSQAESNGIGIESIRNMMKQMNGVCNVEQTDATFEITILFSKQ